MLEWSPGRRKRIEQRITGEIPYNQSVGLMREDFAAALAEIDRLEGLLKLADRIAEKSREIKLQGWSAIAAAFNQAKEE